MSQMSNKDYIFIKENNDQASGIFCQVCNFLIRTSDDAQTFSKWNACHDCYLRFIESRKEAWANGWRPNNEDIEKLYSEKSRIFIQ